MGLIRSQSGSPDGASIVPSCRPHQCAGARAGGLPRGWPSMAVTITVKNETCGANDRGLAAVTGFLEIAFDTSSFSLIASAAGSRLLSRDHLIREKLRFCGE
jgi:hypothetical protein